jgi:multimeric flavodoxin WrbA
LNPIILFASSRRQGNTGALVDAVAKGLEAEIVDLSVMRIAEYDYDHRNRDDDFEPLMARVLDCNPIIFATPIYWYSCAPPMKVFLDRITDFLDLPELLDAGRRLRGKSAYVVCTSVREEPSPHFVGAFQDTFEYLGMLFGGVLHVDCTEGYRPARHQALTQNFVDEVIRTSGDG